MSIADVLSGAASWHVEHGDCMDVLRSLPDGCVDAVVTDPPYFRVKDADWDHAWPSADAFMAWMRGLLVQFRRVLRPNGSIYVFAGPEMAASVECAVADQFAVLNQIVWAKPSGRHNGCHKPGLRAYFPQTERIIFAEPRGSDGRAASAWNNACDGLRADVFGSLREYLCEERDRAGWTTARVDAEWRKIHGGRGGMAGHWFGASQWALPTRANYDWLRSLFNADALRREYDALRREYDALRREYEDLRRPFSVGDGPHTDVWCFPVVQHVRGKHPCEKPAAMADHIIAASTRRGGVVLDVFCGSGVFGASAVAAGRRFIGCDMDPAWVAAAGSRIAAASVVLPGIARAA